LIVAHNCPFLPVILKLAENPNDSSPRVRPLSPERLEAAVFLHDK